jgi:hypothetical protein
MCKVGIHACENTHTQKHNNRVILAPMAIFFFKNSHSSLASSIAPRAFPWDLFHRVMMGLWLAKL